MKHTVCFIDDKIPVAQYSEYFNDTDIISSSVIKYLLKQKATNWEDVVVKNMCEKLLNEPENWSVSAFTSPDFYNNYIKDTIYVPEIVIYDWDYNYGAGSDESEKHLQEILKTSYTMIFVFSGSDHIDEINEIVSKEEFKKFGDRLSVVDKNENNSIDSVFSQIEQKESNNFSFAYGFEVVRNSNKTMNSILSEVSLLSIESFVSSIGEFDGNKYISTNEQFIDAIMPRFKSVLQNTHTLSSISVKKTAEPELNSIREIWAYRLYDKTTTNNVQMGDIIKDDNNDYFLVVSSDCHLLDFWKKNFGYIAVIPMSIIESDDAKKLIKRNHNLDITSLTSNKKSPMTILPCLQTDEGLKDFLIIPKTIRTIEIEKNNEQQRSLLYENFDGYFKVTSVADPFKSPLIQFIMDNITGYGCPDYPKVLKDDLVCKIEKLQS